MAPHDRSLANRIDAARALWAAAACAAGLAGMWVVAQLVPAAQVRDAVALKSFTALARPRVDVFANAVAHVADPLPYALVGLALAAVALARGRPRLAVAIPLLLAGAAAMAEALKPLLAHPHAWSWLGSHQITAASWPSGHSTAAMAMALAAVLVSPPRLRPAVAALGTLLAVGVGFSLLTLAWHLPSDVVGGYLVAALWTALVVAALRVADARWPARSGRRAVTRARAAVGAARAPALAPAGALAAALAAIVLLRPHQATAFAADNHLATAVALAIAGLAASLAGALALALAR